MKAGSIYSKLALGLLMSLGGLNASSASVVVPGSADPFLAGQPAGTACCGGDAAPGQSPILALSGALGGTTYTFSATGGVNYGGAIPVPATSADGDIGGFFDLAADFGTGISGPQSVFTDGLLGVFTDGSISTVAPGQRNDGVSFATLAPGLFQIFWIGDGLTGNGDGTGAVQQFVAPAGATRLYLGTADGSGWYNNSGAITVSVGGGVPEASTWAMMLLGFAGLYAAGQRTRRANKAAA